MWCSLCPIAKMYCRVTCNKCNTKGLWFTIGNIKKRERHSSNSKNEWMDASSKWILLFPFLHSWAYYAVFNNWIIKTWYISVIVFCIWKIGFFTVVVVEFRVNSDFSIEMTPEKWIEMKTIRWRLCCIPFEILWNSLSN